MATLATAATELPAEQETSVETPEQRREAVLPEPREQMVTAVPAAMLGHQALAVPEPTVTPALRMVAPVE